jgi:hypothetical protein
MNFDSPPMFEHLFLESPWAVVAVCVIASIVLIAVGRQRRSKRLAGVSVATLALAVGIWALANAVTTDREQLIQDTQDLVAATGPLDGAALDRLIDPNVTVSGPDGTVWLGSGLVTPRLHRVVSRFGVNGQRTRNVQAIAHDTGWGESTVTVRTDLSSTGGAPINTGWRLTWHRGPETDGGWRVVDIRWMRFQGREVQRGMIP